ncbi:aftiphilin-like [Stegodyphus dumicola]|uniref:aftiphilin-like n=1 Tax=Stegodyphus dumicola TaxID=202533 RepID=UPI0015B19572|nr:aftiphilin-like [Stegodyphus dumicola]
MASNIIPMLSSSPPPIDDCPDNDDDDDEFGTFTSANIGFDSSFDSPVAGNKYNSFKSGDNGVNDINLKSDLNTLCSCDDSEMPSPKDFFSNISKNKCSDISSSPVENEKCIKEISSDQIFCKSNKKGSVEVKNFLVDERLITDSEDVFSNSMNNSFHAEISPAESERISANVYEKSVSSEQDDFSNCSIQSNLQNELNCINIQKDSHNNRKAENVSEPTSENTSKLCAPYDATSGVESHGDKSLRFETTSLDTESISEQFQASPKNDENVHYGDFDFAVKGDDFPVDFSVVDSIDEFDNFQKANFDTSAVCENEGLYSPSLPNAKNSNLCTAVVEDKSDDFQAFDAECDDFDDFQSCKKFGPAVELKSDFHFSADSKNDSFDTFQNGIVSGQESDDFDEFQACSKTSGDEVDGFADFEGVEFNSTNQLPESESCEFADFEGAAFGSASQEMFPSTSCNTSTIQERSFDKISTVINAIFPVPDMSDDTDTSDEVESEILEQSNKSRRLWEKLHEVEQTPGLRFQWGVSHSFQQLLRSVNVDYHSILRTSSVPIFASSLSLLEPIKGQTSSANQEPEDRNQSSPRDPIPPVEFDWNSSGLVNPLDSGQAVSTLMDLSFLSSTETPTSSAVSNHSFENEFLKPSPILTCSESSSKPQILEQLLSKNVSSLPNSNFAHRPSDLSAEATHVLDQLPDLSFMRAKVLMFPISSKT